MLINSTSECRTLRLAVPLFALFLLAGCGKKAEPTTSTEPAKPQAQEGKQEHDDQDRPESHIVPFS